MTRLPTLRRAAFGVLVTALAACGSASVPNATPTGAPSVASVASPTPAPATVSVDLVFTGSHPFVAKGSAGKCGTGHQFDGTAVFTFFATEADYPGFGDGFSMDELRPDFAEIKWALGGTTGWMGFKAGSIVLSADHLSVRVDGDLAGLDAEHVSGTVTCPAVLSPTVAPLSSDTVAFGQAFLAIVDPMRTEWCRGYALVLADYDAHPDGTLAGQKQAYGIIGQALANAAASLRALQPPAVVKNEFEALLPELDKFAVVGGAVTNMTSLTELSGVQAAANNELNVVGAFSGLVRAKLGLPPSAPCS
jgi:hypothetical protein